RIGTDKNTRIIRVHPRAFVLLRADAPVDVFRAADPSRCPAKHAQPFDRHRSGRSVDHPHDVGRPADGAGEEALGGLFLLVFDVFAVFERAEPAAFDAAEMDEDILALGAEDEAETLLRIEPLDGAI